MNTIEWLGQNGFADVIDKIRTQERKWGRAGKGTRKSWPKVLAGLPDGRACTVDGVEYPIIDEFRERAGLRPRAQVNGLNKAVPTTSIDTQYERSVMLPISVLNPATFNPGVRITDSAVRGLMHEIQQHGILAEMHVVHRPDVGYVFTLADGHRRHRCAQDLGIREVRVRLYNGPDHTPPLIWERVNSGVRPIKGAEWLCAWSDSKHEVHPPHDVMAKINRCLEIFGGEKEVRRCLIDSGIAPNIGTEIDRVNNIAKGYPKLNHHPTLKAIGEWMAKHKAQDECGSLLKSTLPPATIRKGIQKICNAIAGDKKL